MELVNCTPHSITLCASTGEPRAEIPTSGTIARCDVQRATIEFLSSPYGVIPINAASFGAVYGLPDPAPGVLYIVARPVAEACRGQRDDLLIVDDTVRDAAGRVVGCRALARL